MSHNPTCHLDHFPAERGNGLLGPRFWTGEPFEADEKIIGDHPYSEKDSIRIALPTGHSLHPDPILQLFVKVLRLSSLIMPGQDLARILVLF